MKNRMQRLYQKKVTEIWNLKTEGGKQKRI